MTPHRRADDLTPKDDRELEAILADLSKRDRAARKWRDRRVRVVAAFVVAAALIGAWRIEIAFDQIHQTARMDRQHAFETCQLINDNARALNGLIDTVVLRIQTSDIPPKDKTQAVALYERSKQSLPVCTKP